MSCFKILCNFLFFSIAAITYVADIVNVIYYLMSNNNSYQKVFVQHPTQITPSTWVYDIYLVIYPLLLIWFIFMFYLIICRQFCNKSRSTIFRSGFWILLTIANIFDIIGLHYFTSNGLLRSSISFLVQTIMLYRLSWIAFSVCWKHVSDNNNNDNPQDIEYNNDVVELNRCELILFRFLSLNVFPLFAVFNSIVLCWQWSVVVEHYIAHWSDDMACLIMLGILTIVLVIYWNMDLLWFRNYFVWTWLPLFAVICSFSAILVKQGYIGGKHKPALLLAFIILIASGVQLVLKIFFLCFCPSKQNPQFSRV